MRAAIYTLGCKVNQYETQALESELVRRGHTLVPFEEMADAYFINTCTVTAVSDRKSRQMIRQARRRSPNAVVAVLGCYAQTSPETVAALDVDVIAGTSGRLALLDRVEKFVADRTRPDCPQTQIEDVFHLRAFERLPAGGLEGRTRAMLKVEDGCVNFCTYCVIPYARGRVRSLPLREAVAQTRRLAQEGFCEIVLTGIELSSWGQDLGQSLIDLIEAVCTAAPGLRVRLGSLEPRTITEDFCRRARALPNLCPHFHLSLQSGCDTTLARMGRKYDTRRYFQSVQMLRACFDRPGLTTDLIAGFPGETEEEFARTLDFLRQCAFAAVHIFPYSRRAGTPAAGFPEQLSRAEKESRVRRAAQVAGQTRRAWLEQWPGQTLPVLFEQSRQGCWQGHAPNYTDVFLPDHPAEDLKNQIRPVSITRVRPDLSGLEGEIRAEWKDNERRPHCGDSGSPTH